jgi:hypothetical protein
MRIVIVDEILNQRVNDLESDRWILYITNMSSPSNHIIDIEWTSRRITHVIGIVDVGRAIVVIIETIEDIDRIMH